MPIPAREFRQWGETVAPGANLSGLAELAHINRKTLGSQLLRGKVLEQVPVAISRSLSINPITTLAGFEGFTGLVHARTLPSSLEVLSQVHYTDILSEIARRGYPEKQPPTELRPFPFADSVRSWLDAIDPGKMRTHLAETVGISEAAISAQLSLNKLSPQLALEAAQYAQMSPATALVVTGVVYPEEAGWAQDLRLATLTSVSGLVLLDFADYWIGQLRRATRQALKENEVIDSLWRNL